MFEILTQLGAAQGILVLIAGMLGSALGFLGASKYMTARLHAQDQYIDTIKEQRDEYRGQYNQERTENKQLQADAAKYEEALRGLARLEETKLRLLDYIDSHCQGGATMVQGLLGSLIALPTGEAKIEDGPDGEKLVQITATVPKAGLETDFGIGWKERPKRP